MRKSTLGLTLGTVLILVGILLSVGANYGLIKDVSTFEKALNFGQQGWTQNILLAELELSPGDTVTFIVPKYRFGAQIGKAFTISVKDNFGYAIMAQKFVYQTINGQQRFDPDTQKPFYLFTAQNTGRYTVYASPYQGDFSYDDFTFNVVVTHPPPYTLVLLLGLVVLALGIISIVYGVMSSRRESSSPSPSPGERPESTHPT